MTDDIRSWLDELLSSHHSSLHDKLDRIIQMSETTDQAIADLTALEQTTAAALAKLKADVEAFLAGLTSTGTLTTAQQAGVDALKASMGADATTASGIDSSLPAAPAPPGP